MGEAIEAVVRTDGAVARVAGVEMDAAGVEEAISALLAVRAAMLPRRLPVVFAGTRIAVGTEGALHVQREPDGRVLVCVHHDGMGWVGARVEVGVLAGVMLSAVRPSRRRASARSPRS